MCVREGKIFFADRMDDKRLRAERETKKKYFGEK